MGCLWLSKEGFETATIPRQNREQAICAFCKMSERMAMRNDCFWTDTDFYEHTFSYGIFCDFIFGSWNSFSSCPSLEGISQTAYQLLTNSWYQSPAKKTKERQEFNCLSGHKGTAGFEQSSMLLSSSYVYDKNSWEKWHEEWLTSHPEDIDWSLTENDFFPNPDCVQEILRKEIETHGQTMHLNQSSYTGKANCLALVFHEYVMRKKGPETEAYAVKIGDIICRSNYYHYEEQLSKKESNKSHSHRYIYGIYNYRLKRKQYVSIDVAHGMFELHDEKGQHLGEYHFDGSYNAAPEEDHALTCINE